MAGNIRKAYSGVYTGEFQENGVVRYKGIRFANAERWQRPVVVPASGAEIDATAFGPRSDAGDPGCLNLVLYTVPNEIQNKPVFMWQYGSAQFGGDNSLIDFSNFVAAHPDIIVICPNHRGQFFGSIDLSVLEGYEEKAALYGASNNLARLDLLACLQWIRENIASFGGDPFNVTIGGHSSGSNNMTCLMMMPEAQPYFQKAVCQASFCCDTSLQPLDTARIVAREFFGMLGVSTLEEALAVPTEKINETLRDMMKRVMGGEAPFCALEYKLFAPVMDNVVLSEDCFEKMASGGLKGKKLIFGHNSGEYDMQFSRFKPDWKAALDFTIQQNFGKLSDHGWNRDHADEVIKDYFSRNEEYGRDNFTAAMDLKNDLMLRCDAVMFALAASTQADTYMYFSDWEAEPVPGQRVSHGTENEVLAGCRKIPEDKKRIAAFLQDIWASFIRNGRPESPILEEPWRKFNGRTFDTLFISEAPHMVQGIRVEDLKLLLPLLREYPVVADIIE